MIGHLAGAHDESTPRTGARILAGELEPSAGTVLRRAFLEAIGIER